MGVYMRAGWLMSGVMAAVVAGCGGSSPDQVRACTEIGCESGLTVRIAEGAGEPLSVEVSGPGAVARTVRCDTGRGCADGIFFRDFVADSVTVRVTTGAGVTTRTARPEYQTVQPNGEGCPPTCRQGEVLVEAAPVAAAASRPATIVDTLMVEGMAEPMPLRLVRPSGDFPLRFSTYIPEDWEAETTTSGQGPAFRIRPGPRWMAGAEVEVVVYPEGTSRSEASALARSVATMGGGQVGPLADPHGWALEAHRFRRPGDDAGGRITGWIELGRRDDRFFHLSARHPAEMGDGMGPRVAAIERHWRWEPSGETLGR